MKELGNNTKKANQTSDQASFIANENNPQIVEDSVDPKLKLNPQNNSCETIVVSPPLRQTSDTKKPDLKRTNTFGDPEVSEQVEGTKFEGFAHKLIAETLKKWAS